MTRQEFYDLETLLGKLSMHLEQGAITITTGHVQDGYHVGTFDEHGKVEYQASWASLEGAADRILKQISEPAKQSEG